MYLSILTLPLLSAFISGFLGRKIGSTGSHLLSVLCLVTAAILSVLAFFELSFSQCTVTIYLSSWIDSEFLSVNWAFLVDDLTVSMLMTVLVVSSLVHIYSVNYMGEDPHQQRFFSYLSLFTFFMLILVAGDNYLVMFVGWEGIGVSSYLLINFWFTRITANKSAIQAFTVNRVGDLFLSVAFFGLFLVFGNLDYSTLFALSPFINETTLTIIGILLLLAAMGKSAQLGLHTWLPSAMEGPTPVSALIHAATLVTAGVFLLLKSSPLLEYASLTLLIITWVGAITAFVAATTGLLQNDIKRVIAYSTMSQMGYLFMAIGLSQFNVALFHLVNHAFFKALLFLSAGGVLHSFTDQQDLRKFGGLVKLLPFTYTCILIGSMSLMALPFLTGFYSKDLILELASVASSDQPNFLFMETGINKEQAFTGQIVYWLGTITAVITAFYSFRLISLTFFTYPNAKKNDYLNVHEQPLIIAIPLVILSLLAIFFGYLAKDLFVGGGSLFLSAALFTLPSHIYLIEAEFAPGHLFVKLLPFIGTVLGGFTAWLAYHYWEKFIINLSIYSKNVFHFFNGKYYFDIIYNKYIINNALKLGFITSTVIDIGAVELVGPLGLSNSLHSISRKIASLDNGVVTQYALFLLMGMFFLTLISFAPHLGLNILSFKWVVFLSFSLYFSLIREKTTTI